MNIQVHTPEELHHVSDELVRLVRLGYRIFLLKGDLGAGKTTLVQDFCGHVQVTEPVSSPTFSLINGYLSPAFGMIYHMDLYRIEKEQDLVQLGLEEYLDSGHICLIEWPGIASAYIHPPLVEISISVESDNLRIFKITTHDTVDA